VLSLYSLLHVMYTELRREKYTHNYTYTNSFFILRTEFHVARVQTKFFQSFSQVKQLTY